MIISVISITQNVIMKYLLIEVEGVEGRGQGAGLGDTKK